MIESQVKPQNDLMASRMAQSGINYWYSQDHEPSPNFGWPSARLSLGIGGTGADHPVHAAQSGGATSATTVTVPSLTASVAGDQLVLVQKASP